MEILYIIWTIYSIFCVMFTSVFLWNLVRNIRKEIDIVKGTDAVKKTLKLVYVEQVNDMFHMYDTVNHTFICQAPTEKELWDIADTRFPNVTVLTTSISAEATKQ